MAPGDEDAELQQALAASLDDAAAPPQHARHAALKDAARPAGSGDKGSPAGSKPKARGGKGKGAAGDKGGEHEGTPDVVQEVRGCSAGSSGPCAHQAGSLALLTGASPPAANPAPDPPPNLP
jgi:hypothetical protein